MGMHSAVQRESRARRKAEGKITDSEDTDPEEDKGEMDNFQDLQLGSITPVVRLGDNSSSPSSSNRFSTGYGSGFCALIFGQTSPTIYPGVTPMQFIIYAYGTYVSLADTLTHLSLH